MPTVQLSWGVATEVTNTIGWTANSISGNGSGTTMSAAYQDVVRETAAALVDGSELPASNILLTKLTAFGTLDGASPSGSCRVDFAYLDPVINEAAFRTRVLTGTPMSRAFLFFSPAYNGAATVVSAKTFGVSSAFTASASGLGLEVEYEVVGPPVQTSISPDSGSSEGGTLVHIFGSNFRPYDENDLTLDAATPTVTFDGIPATDVVWVSDTELTCVTPAHAAGAVDVVVTNPDGQDCTLTLIYTYVAPVFAMDQMVLEIVYPAQIDVDDPWHPGRHAPGGDAPGRIGGGIRRPFVVTNQWQVHRLDFKPRPEETA